MKAEAPKQLPDGRWAVGGETFETNAQAWRWIDRQENEPVSRSEDVGDWAFNQSVNRTFAGDRVSSYAKAAAKCHDGKTRDAVATKWTKKKQREHDARRLGTFGAASPVRHIDPSEYKP